MLFSLLIPREQHDEQVSSPVVLCKINRTTLDLKGESSDEISAKKPKKNSTDEPVASTGMKTHCRDRIS